VSWKSSDREDVDKVLPSLIVVLADRLGDVLSMHRVSGRRLSMGM
jgi:hypothetical protein